MPPKKETPEEKSQRLTQKGEAILAHADLNRCVSFMRSRPEMIASLHFSIHCFVVSDGDGLNSSSRNKSLTSAIGNRRRIVVEIFHPSSNIDGRRGGRSWVEWGGWEGEGRWGEQGGRGRRRGRSGWVVWVCGCVGEERWMVRREGRREGGGGWWFWRAVDKRGCLAQPRCKVHVIGLVPVHRAPKKIRTVVSPQCATRPRQDSPHQLV